MHVLLVVACLLLGGYGHFAENDWLGEDEALHSVSSAALTVASVQIAHDHGLHGARQARFSLSFSLTFDADEELYNSRSTGSGWSWKDLTQDLTGAAAGYGLYQVTK